MSLSTGGKLSQRECAEVLPVIVRWYLVHFGCAPGPDQEHCVSCQPQWISLRTRWRIMEASTCALLMRFHFIGISFRRDRIRHLSHSDGVSMIERRNCSPVIHTNVLDRALNCKPQFNLFLMFSNHSTALRSTAITHRTGMAWIGNSITRARAQRAASRIPREMIRPDGNWRWTLD